MAMIKHNPNPNLITINGHSMTKLRICKDCGLVVVPKGISFCSTCKRERVLSQKGDHKTIRVSKGKTPEMCRYGKCRELRGDKWYCFEHNKQQTDRLKAKRWKEFSDDDLREQIGLAAQRVVELRVELERRMSGHG